MKIFVITAIIIAIIITILLIAGNRKIRQITFTSIITMISVAYIIVMIHFSISEIIAIPTALSLNSKILIIILEIIMELLALLFGIWIADIAENITMGHHLWTAWYQIFKKNHK